MNIFSRTDIPAISGVTCKIERRHAGGQFPACRTVYFASREAAIAFRNAVYALDVADWKRRRSEVRKARKAGRHSPRPSKIARPEMLAIDWHTLSLRFVKKVGDFARERNNRAGRLL